MARRDIIRRLRPCNPASSLILSKRIRHSKLIRRITALLPTLLRPIPITLPRPMTTILLRP